MGTGNAAAVPAPTFANGLYFIVYGGGKPHEKTALKFQAKMGTGNAPTVPVPTFANGLYFIVYGGG